MNPSGTGCGRLCQDGADETFGDGVRIHAFRDDHHLARCIAAHRHHAATWADIQATDLDHPDTLSLSAIAEGVLEDAGEGFVALGPEAAAELLAAFATQKHGGRPWAARRGDLARHHLVFLAHLFPPVRSGCNAVAGRWWHAWSQEEVVAALSSDVTALMSTEVLPICTFTPPLLFLLMPVMVPITLNGTALELPDAFGVTTATS